MGFGGRKMVRFHGSEILAGGTPSSLYSCSVSIMAGKPGNKIEDTIKHAKQICGGCVFLLFFNDDHVFVAPGLHTLEINGRAQVFPTMSLKQFGVCDIVAMCEWSVRGQSDGGWKSQPGNSSLPRPSTQHHLASEAQGLRRYRQPLSAHAL